ncbi:hypothetical protein DFH07DRAFT_1063448 [Mycena maculata]|uniref:Uncharacterized protein n=1 Tax=Mycena maculata TaxID=230809 RepID=A0AAD7N3E8_9AGAR|nr:hypothetical protein DFH07DRAFT_1063448 [Mycena maculata]
MELSLPEPTLPRELERSIFEVSALSRPTTIPNLMLVAQRVKVWVEPFLYHGIILSDMDPVSGFPIFSLDVVLRAIDQKPPEFLKYAVKHLFLDVYRRYDARQQTASYLDTVLKACTGITSLVASTGLIDNLSTLASLDSLRRLTIDLREVFETNPQNCFAHSLFRNITHLEIIEFPNDQFTGITLIPHLTHFAFNDAGLCATLRPAFHSCARLTCIILLCGVTAAKTDVVMVVVQPLLEDGRFVIISQSNFREDWYRSVYMGNGYWALADAFLAARRAGKVDRGRFSISDEDESWFE